MQTNASPARWSARALRVGLGVAVAAGPGCARLDSTLKVSTYYDTRGLPTGTVTGSLSHTGFRTRLYSFANVEPDSKVPRYLEASVTQPLRGRLAAVVEYNRNFNSVAGTNRLGISFQSPLPEAFSGDRLTVKYTPFSTRDRGPQLNFSASKLIGEDMYIEGFFDYDLKPDLIVTDWQFGRRIAGPLYGVVEYRHNSALAESTGLGIGVEWVIR